MPCIDNFPLTIGIKNPLEIFTAFTKCVSVFTLHSTYYIDYIEKYIRKILINTFTKYFEIRFDSVTSKYSPTFNVMVNRCREFDELHSEIFPP